MQKSGAELWDWGYTNAKVLRGGSELAAYVKPEGRKPGWASAG